MTGIDELAQTGGASTLPWVIIAIVAIALAAALLIFGAVRKRRAAAIAEPAAGSPGVVDSASGAVDAADPLGLHSPADPTTSADPATASDPTTPNDPTTPSDPTTPNDPTDPSSPTR